MQPELNLMSSGWSIALNTTGAYTIVDCVASSVGTSITPRPNSVAVVLRVIGASGGLQLFLRQNGSTDDFAHACSDVAGMGSFIIGLDAAMKFQYFVGATGLTLEVMGFLSSQMCFMATNATSKATVTVTSYVVTTGITAQGSDVPKAAIGFMSKIDSVSAIDGWYVRMNGSTDTRQVAGSATTSNDYVPFLTPVDGSNQFQQYINTVDQRCYCNGYLMNNTNTADTYITFATNGTSRTTGTTGSFQTITAPAATGILAIFYEMYNSNASGTPTFELRGIGDSQDDSGNNQILSSGSGFNRYYALVPCLGADQAQQKISTTNCLLFERGWITATERGRTIVS